MSQSPGFLDRYPAKMVGHLARDLIDRYVSSDGKILDPFCGSGAILLAAKERGLDAIGFDLNPYAALLSRVKLEGFDTIEADLICSEFIARAQRNVKSRQVRRDECEFWFTPGTLNKYERLRFAANHLALPKSRSGRAVLLAFALSVRRCSKADQRSPKPYISKSARTRRSGKHFDPFVEIPRILNLLSEKQRKGKLEEALIHVQDIRRAVPKYKASFSHVITSPPYINAQDYFRNFRLELCLLEGILEFSVDTYRFQCIGTERGSLLDTMDLEDIEKNRLICPELENIEKQHIKQAAVVHRYLSDMGAAFDSISELLKEDGILVLVCGDNLIAGERIQTWRLLRTLLRERGFKDFDKFGDKIERRYVPPRRLGHRGLIKQEMVIAYRKG